MSPGGREDRVLTNEMFATSLRLWLGLPMPQVAAIEVSAWLIGNTRELQIEIAHPRFHAAGPAIVGSL